MIQTKCEHGYLDQYAFVVLPLLSASFPHYIYCVWFQTIGPPQQLTPTFHTKKSTKKRKHTFLVSPQKNWRKSPMFVIFFGLVPPQTKWALSLLSSWWFQPNWKILVKLEIFPNLRGLDKKKIFETTTQLIVMEDIGIIGSVKSVGLHGFFGFLGCFRFCRSRQASGLGKPGVKMEPETTT